MDKNLTIDTVIFDVGQVLVAFDWEGYMDSFGFAPQVWQAVAEAVFLSPQWAEMDKGLLPDREYPELFARNNPAYREEIREVLENSGNSIRLYDYAVPWVRCCREQGLRTYILSNYSRHLFCRTKHCMPFRMDMDGEVFSFQVGQIKPDPAIYRALLDKYSIMPQRALFVDDRQENLDAAARLQIHPLLFTTYEDTWESMKKLLAE